MARNGLRVCVVAEKLATPLDEGGSKLAYSLLQALGEHCQTLGLSVGGGGSANEVVCLPPSKTFVERGLRREVQSFAPHLLCYIPSASITLFAILRARLLKLYASSARTVLVALQPRKHSLLARRTISLLRPDLVLAQGKGLLAYALSLGCRAALLPPGVDLERFRPVGRAEKRERRLQYGLPEDGFLVLHVGHAKEGRNVEVLARLRPHASAVMVAGRSTGIDLTLVDELRRNQVTVIDRYVENIEEVYQAADCYVFPVWSPDRAIEMPLSVLEAMACNLPVVTTAFGGLPDVFQSGPGIRLVSNEAQLIESIRSRAWMQPCETRPMVEPYPWAGVAQSLLESAG